MARLSKQNIIDELKEKKQTADKEHATISRLPETRSSYGAKCRLAGASAAYNRCIKLLEQ